MMWLRNNWDRLIFPSFFLLFIVMMILEYYEGNCRIGIDMGICGILWE